jgi:hypothetical protein
MSGYRLAIDWKGIGIAVIAGVAVGCALSAWFTYEVAEFAAKAFGL